MADPNVQLTVRNNNSNEKSKPILATYSYTFAVTTFKNSKRTARTFCTFGHNLCVASVLSSIVSIFSPYFFSLFGHTSSLSSHTSLFSRVFALYCQTSYLFSQISALDAYFFSLQLYFLSLQIHISYLLSLLWTCNSYWFGLVCTSSLFVRTFLSWAISNASTGTLRALRGKADSG